MSNFLTKGLATLGDNRVSVDSENLGDIINALEEYENYLCQCLSVFAQHNIAPPDPPEMVGRVLSEKFINAIKGE